MSRALSIAPLLWLLLGSVGPILIGNIVVPWFAWVEPDDPAMLAAFAGAMTLSRMPTQFVSAAFSPMMAALSASADRGDWSGHGRLLTRALRLAWILGVAFVVVFVVAGQWVLRIYLGPSYSVPAWTLGLLALASAGVFFATVQQASLAARLQWAWIALAWGLATVMFAGVLLLPVSALVRASLAPAIAVGGAVAVNSARLRQNRLRSVASDQR